MIELEWKNILAIGFAVGFIIFCMGSCDYLSAKADAARANAGIDNNGNKLREPK